MKKSKLTLILSLSFSVLLLTACVSEKQEIEVTKTEVEPTEECETTKKAELENLLEEKQDTAFDLSGTDKNTGCTLGN